MNRFTFVGQRTDASSGLERDVQVQAEIRLGHGNEPWLYLLDGPTGHESMPVAWIPMTISEGWPASFGGHGCDRLVIPGSELQKVVEELS